MTLNLTKWLRIYYSKIIQSIAFYPAIIAVGFLLLSWIMIEADFSEWGKALKSNLDWLSLKDANTARTIIATIAGAIISLTVFSFSMVMIVLNQAASQMSNRVLSSMIDNRFQQIVLGFYIGTVVYALFLLSTIRDVESGIYVPALSIYLLIIFTVIDIFLFIYFLEYVTQTVKYETIINRIKDKALHAIDRNFEPSTTAIFKWESLPCYTIKVQKSDYFQGFNQKILLELANQNDFFVSFMYEPATYLIKDVVLLKVYTNHAITDEIIEQVASTADFFNGQPIERNATYGFRQLTEIAIKALSPGINDPGTAITALNALADLFSQHLYCELPQIRKDKKGTDRIFVPIVTFDTLFERSVQPIWNYGKNDFDIQHAFIHLIDQLIAADFKQSHTNLFVNFRKQITVQN